MTTADAFNLQRFVDAQNGVFETALAELRGGHKRTHWMWFIFPQIRGLGESDTSRFYAISGLGEAKAYLDHDVLGPRLVEATQAVLDNKQPLRKIFHSPDDLKFKSSMTLFAAASNGASVFRTAASAFGECSATHGLL